MAGPNGGAKDIEFGQKSARRRESGQGDQNNGENPPDPGIPASDAGEIVEVEGLMARTAEGDDRGERSDSQEEISRQVEEESGRIAM
jgi:hypothetical protein